MESPSPNGTGMIGDAGYVKCDRFYCENRTAVFINNENPDSPVLTVPLRTVVDIKEDI
jgi:hypothetical protein